MLVYGQAGVRCSWCQINTLAYTAMSRFGHYEGWGPPTLQRAYQGSSKGVRAPWVRPQVRPDCGQATCRTWIDTKGPRPQQGKELHKPLTHENHTQTPDRHSSSRKIVTYSHPHNEHHGVQATDPRVAASTHTIPTHPPHIHSSSGYRHTKVCQRPETKAESFV